MNAPLESVYLPSARLCRRISWLCLGFPILLAAALLSAANFSPYDLIDPTNATASNAPMAVASILLASGSSNSFSTMETLEDKHKLRLGDRLSFRIVEDLDDPKETLDPRPPLLVTDSGDVEVPYIGRFPASGKTCRQLAREIKTELEKKYYYQATVMIGLDVHSKTTGTVYVLGAVRLTGPVDMPGDENLTVGKAILRAGGFTNYANKRGVKVTRKSDGSVGSEKTQTFAVNVSDILEKGRADKDLTLEPGDVIYVPTRLINF